MPFQAFFEVDSARNYNKTVLKNLWLNDKRDIPLRRLPKMKTGYMAGPAFTNANLAVDPNLPAPIGTVCPECLFPPTYGELSGFTLDQIRDLSKWYNDSFGIDEQNDNVQVRREKFVQFIQNLVD